jgi:RNA polymerase sigma-70 factor (ECF subfamily)
VPDEDGIVRVILKTEPTTAAIWSDLSADLWRFIRRRVSDEHVADDLLQEAFVRIHRHLGDLKEADRLVAWVYQIARNVVHDHFRKAPGATLPLGDSDPPDEVEGQWDAVRSRAAEWLDELIQQLPENYREAVRLSEIEGLPQQEVANRMGLSLSGAKSRIQRGRALLKGVLDQCCTFQFDRRGNLTECDPKPDRTVCLNCDK